MYGGSNICMETCTYFQLTLGQKGARERGMAPNRSINHKTSSPTLPVRTQIHPHTPTHCSIIHGLPCQTEPIILREAMSSLMSSINSNHGIRYDGDGFLCLFAPIKGQCDCLGKLLFISANFTKVKSLNVLLIQFAHEKNYFN